MRKPISAAAAASLLLAGCGTAAEPAATSSPTPHGYVEGAEEAAEPQRRLVFTDARGTVTALDPVDERAEELAAVDGVERLATDGRFVYAATGETATVIDSGVWTVDHGDHRHYYRAEPGRVGEVDAGEELTVVGDTAVTVLNSTTGVTVLDRPALEAGRIEPAAKVSAAAALPFGGKLLAADTDGTVEVLGREGGTESRLDATCEGARTPAVTNRGAVFACEDGALVITDSGDGFDAELARYPRSAGGIASGFGHRPDTPLLGATTADGTGLVLDVAERTWIELDGPPALTVTGTGEEGPVLALTEDGKLRAYDTNGEPAGDRTVLDPIGAGDPRPRLQVDPERAYLTDPGRDRLHEIDVADDLRVARELATGASPELLTETGW